MCYLALVNIELLTMRYQRTLWPELSIMSWLQSKPSSHKVGPVPQQSILRWIWYIRDWEQAELDSMKQEAQSPMPPVHVASVPPIAPIGGLKGGPL